MSTRRRRSQIGRGEAAGAILEAAAELFAKDGYAATQIVDIADRAGVGRPTVFTAVGTKSVVFQTVLERAVAGDNPGVPAAEQPWFLAVLDEPDPTRMIASFVHNIRLIGERISDLYWAAESGAESDETVREVFRRIADERLDIGRRLAHTLAARTPLRTAYDEIRAADVLNAVASPASWRALVRDAGWSPDEFEDWAVDNLCGTLLPDQT